MRPPQRHDEIVNLVSKQGQMTVDDLADRLDVSRETIRRDLSMLDDLGRLQKYHGGARIRSNALSDIAIEGPFAQRLAANSQAKRDIAYAAASLLAPGDSLFIDTGTTTLFFAEALVGLPGMTVITNSARIAMTVAANHDHKVFLIGGAFSPDASETVGSMATDQITRFRTRHAFLTVGSVDASGVLDFNEGEAEVAKAMMGRAETTTVLADSTKYRRQGILEVAQWPAIARLVTEKTPPQDILAGIDQAGTDLLLSGAR